MHNEEKPTEQPFRVALKVALYYGIFGVIWIIGTDLLVTNLPLSPGQMQRIQSIKGIIFVLLSLFVVFFFTWKEGKQAEKVSKKLSKEKRERSVLLKNLPGMAYKCENDGNWTMRFVSDGCKDLTGYAPGEIVDNSLVSYGDLILDEDRQSVFEEVQESLENQQSFELEYRIKIKKGNIKWVWERGRGLFDKVGELEIIHGFISDVTERKNMETALRQSEKKFRNYVENAPVGVFLADKEGKYIDVNPAACEMFGYSEEELLDLNISDLHPSEARDEAGEAFEELLERGEVRKELPYIRKDGNTGYMIVNAVKLSENRFLAFTEDTTEKTRAYRELSRSKKRFKDMADLLPLPIWEADTDGQLIYLNRAGLEGFGYSQKDLEKGVTITDVVAPEDKEKVAENFNKVLEGNDVEGFECTLEKPDGTKLTGLTFSTPILKEGEIQGVRGVVLDITERKEAQRRLEQATFGTLQALNRTIEAKDEYTGEHIDRVREYSAMLGEKVGLSEERLKQLKFASILHDIGKIGVPDSILGKPDKLTEEEWKQMEKHPKIGERIVGQVDQLERAAKIIGQHQEKYDGTGYPKGLEGEDITLEARIIAVVDAWDAMRTDRPYRDALPKEVVLKELKDNAGTQFDPEIVELFLEMIEKGEVEFGEK
ncbi:PAS domain S-box protein [Candidatus Bipolaricaulota bacterium]|nr:PAS domain S-box protein [Candidatus Bipolaricaulota bacterium]